MTGLRTGEVAAAAGVNIQTLRYYERRGLLTEPERSLGGHRRYPRNTVARLRIIKAAQRIGFTLDEVAGLLRRHPGSTLRSVTAAKLAETESRIAELSTARDTLRAALSADCADLLTCSETPSCPLPFEAGSTEESG
ncbi:MerR family transcriptional regulator [Nocardia arthritidis]|uniref:MerR family transcriptional regulator n=1 Tax=Nocardia arthritidis TaxID=228602 RepID=A0A6G9YDA9_9NOCA|nr:MerR family transcriptional regulator [Nocardia arthritidis]QIS11211.1 MerR family transcriptional regulator [Nocardia arthritidis]